VASPRSSWTSTSTDRWVRAGETVENPVTRERLTFIRTAADTGGEVLELDLILAPGGFVPAMHVHPSQEERFEVHAGSPRFRVGATERTASVGEKLNVPPETPHRFWNPASADARLRIELRPALRMEEVLKETARLGRNGKLNRKGLPNPIYDAVLAHEYAAEFGPPPTRRSCPPASRLACCGCASTCLRLSDDAQVFAHAATARSCAFVLRLVAVELDQFAGARWC
jgi:mannose-6-phosphate isomerase-like protein (cupin superfamily)